MPQTLSPSDLLPVAQFSREYPHLGTESSHRWHMFIRRDELESAGCIARRGRRVFIVVPRYLDWMTGRQQAA